ncbi:hypothetical protein GBAR_LOCUS2248, partial [Geodia barretti]
MPSGSQVVSSYLISNELLHSPVPRGGHWGTQYWRRWGFGDEEIIRTPSVSGYDYNCLGNGESAERKEGTAEGIHFSPTREVGRAGSHAGVPIPFHWEDAEWHGDCKVWCGGRILCQLGEGDVTIFTEAPDPSAVPESHLPSPHLPCNQVDTPSLSFFLSL